MGEKAVYRENRSSTIAGKMRAGEKAGGAGETPATPEIRAPAFLVLCSTENEGMSCARAGHSLNESFTWLPVAAWTPYVWNPESSL